MPFIYKYDLFYQDRLGTTTRNTQNKAVVFHTTAGDSESGDTDERRVQFPDGSVDDWGVEDFVLAKPKKVRNAILYHLYI
eukprot:COSAG06_NODE_12594_length_1358_cov_1.629071_1_plen_80_part_00